MWRNIKGIQVRKDSLIQKCIFNFSKSFWNSAFAEWSVIGIFREAWARKHHVIELYSSSLGLWTGKVKTHLQENYWIQNYNQMVKLPHLSYNLYLTLTFCRQFLSHISLTQRWSKINIPYVNEGKNTESMLLGYIMVTWVPQVFLQVALVEKRANGIQQKPKLCFLLAHHYLPERQQKNPIYPFCFMVTMLDYMFSSIKCFIHSVFTRFNP